ncbi:FxsA family protein [bacterium]|jgi:UPF0716 protein FxsA|nr:hypothetical protein [Gemmatimonadota bacterium]MCH2662483.1 FxsA family protein [bacterium]|tara:strand:+ start:405 stop:797 length:393 start_codon:yes stop_codon:yes gene_type:complete
MFVRLLLLFTLVPIVELAVLIEIGQHLGMLPTVALVLATGALGAALARREGIQAFHRLRDSIGQGSFPGEAILDGVLILGGGLLLLTPGILTDLLGFAALVPGTRYFIKYYLKTAIERRIRSGSIQVHTR